MDASAGHRARAKMQDASNPPRAQAAAQKAASKASGRAGAKGYAEGVHPTQQTLHTIIGAQWGGCGMRGREARLRESTLYQ